MIDISIIVVCFNEENNIGPCLESLVRQTYPTDKCEIIAVDGGSKDRTVDVIKDFAATYPHVKLTVEPRKGTAIGRNAGIEAASHPYIAFIDADCEAPSDWLERLEGLFVKHHAEDPKVIAVGGGNVPPTESDSFVQAVGVAIDSFAGSFNSPQGRQFEEVQHVESLATLNVLYDKKAVEDVGGFDVSLGSEAEDAELNFRLRSHGWRFIFIPNLSVLHKFRPTPAIWYKNMVRYGRGRARLLKRHPDMWSISFVLPPLFLLAICSLPLALLHPFFVISGLYFPAIIFYAAALCFRKRRLSLIPHVTLVFVVQHFGYAIGELLGLLNPKVR